MTWDEHKNMAAIMGGDLACITNADDNEQVRRIAGGGCMGWRNSKRLW